MRISHNARVGLAFILRNHIYPDQGGFGLWHQQFHRINGTKISILGGLRIGMLHSSSLWGLNVNYNL